MGAGNSPRYFAAERSFREFRMVRPADTPPAVGVAAAVDEAESIGIAYPTGWREFDDDAGRAAEVTWRLVIHQDELQGRFVLRSGAFVPVEEVPPPLAEGPIGS